MKVSLCVWHCLTAALNFHPEKLQHALRIAVECGNAECAEILIACGGKVNSSCKDSTVAIWFLTCFSPAQFPAVLRSPSSAWLLKRATSNASGFSSTAAQIQQVGSTIIRRQLIETNVSSCIPLFGETKKNFFFLDQPLIFACMNSRSFNLEIVDLLLSHNADVNATDYCKDKIKKFSFFLTKCFFFCNQVAARHCLLRSTKERRSSLANSSSMVPT